MNATLRGRAGLFLVASGLLMAACSSSGSSSSGILPPDTVRVAVEGPMTGPQSSTGIDMWRGAQLMASQINSSGGILDKHLQLIQVDDKADPTTAAATARHAVSQHIAAVIGPYNSAVGLKNLSVYLGAGVVVVRLTSNSKTNNMGVTVQPMDYQVAPIEAAAVEKTPGLKSVAIVYDTSAYTSGVASQMKTLLTAAGLQVVAYESIDSSQTQFTDVLGKVKAAGPGLVYYAAYDPQAEDLVQQAAALGVPGICLVDGLAAQGPTFLSTVSTALATKCVFSGVPTSEQLPGAGNYVAAYQARFHQSPGTWGAFTYDSLGLLAHEVQSVGSWTTSKVNAALFHASGYAGVTGSISIDPATGNRQNPPIVMQTVDSSDKYVVSPVWTSTGALPVLPNL